MVGGRLIVRLFAITALVFVLARPAPAFADQIDDLAHLLTSSSVKTRLSAVISLARLDDKRTLRPLVTALHDPDAQIRALAAAGLGHLGHRAALPALRAAATDDTDANVRHHAHAAAVEVARANHLPESDAPAPPTHVGSGFGHSPHAVHDRPDLYVIVKSSSDDSPGAADKNMRKAHADFLRKTLLDEFRSAPQVTLAADEAERWGLDPLHIDLSVVKMELREEGGFIEMDAELRLAISDQNGKMLSFLSGGAKVQVPRAKFTTGFLPEMRREALDGAMRGMFDKLLAHLRRTAQS